MLRKCAVVVVIMMNIMYTYNNDAVILILMHFIAKVSSLKFWPHIPQLPSVAFMNRLQEHVLVHCLSVHPWTSSLSIRLPLYLLPLPHYWVLITAVIGNSPLCACAHTHRYGSHTRLQIPLAMYICVCESVVGAGEGDMGR